MAHAPTKATVRVPCSTSNMGSGFDALGLALDRYLTATFTPGGTELTVTRLGTLAELNSPHREDLLVSTFVASLSDLTGDPVFGTLSVHSEIPVSRGLGSSAAAVLAGFDLARAVLGRDPDREQALMTAFRRAGHGDHAAPCVLGGLVAVAKTLDGPVAMKATLSDKVGFAYAAPRAGIGTATARDALPSEVSHATAVESLGRFAALLQGLAAGNPDLIRIGVEDQLHVPYRLPLIPGAYNAMSAGHDAGAWAITISGSGSGLLAYCDPDGAAEVADAMRTVFAGGDPQDGGCVGFVLQPDRQGLRREERP